MRILPNRRYRSGTRWCAWRWTDTRESNGQRLVRLHLVQTPAFSLMLHWIDGPDPARNLHDHPVDFVTVPLRGWYDEELQGGALRRVRGPWPHLRRAEHRHRVAAVAPGGAVTLVLAGRVRREWGYWVGTYWVPWRDYQRGAR